MTITCLTCAVHRPEAWKLSELWMSRQTVKPIQWLVVDDDEEKTVCTMGQEYHYKPEFRGRGSLTKKVKFAIEAQLIKGDVLVFWENDDWYAPNYLETVLQRIQRYDIVGEGQALYYNVVNRWWIKHENLQHASLCATAVTARTLPSIHRLVSTSNCPFLDVRIWAMTRYRRKVYASAVRTTIGMKALPGTTGYGNGHGERDRGAQDDLSLDTLASWIGEDAQYYAPFWKDHVPIPELPMPTFPLIGTHGHAANWAKWLGHLRDKPATGIEIGTFRGESAEWMLNNIFTHQNSEYHCVDPFEGSEEHHARKIDCSTCEQETRERLKKFGGWARIWKERSGQFLHQWWGSARMVDFVYVDGDHRKAGVLQDAVLGFDVLKVGGVMIFDDYEWRDMPDCPKKAVDAFLLCYAAKLEVIGRGYQIAIRKTAP